MKRLLLSVMLLLAASTNFAQTWTVGEEITDKVAWGNLSFQDDPFDYWKLESSKGSFTQTGGLFEVYDGADVDLYQIVKLPAGLYRLECQGYYRCGNSWADDPSVFNTSDWQDNALLYVSNGAYDIESEAFTVGRTFKTPLMPRLFDTQSEQIYTMPEGEASWDMSDGFYEAAGTWGPCSVPGSLAWFSAGKYQPYNEDGVKYNTVTFFLTEDGYAKLGVSKKEIRSADSFMATNFRLYYEGEAGEAAELMALQDEVAEYYTRIEALENSYGEGLIYTVINDAMMEFDDQFGIIENLTKEQCAEALAALKLIDEQAQAASAAYKKLEAVMKDMNILLNSTDYEGKAAFTEAVADADALLDPNYEIQEGDSFDTFQKAYEKICAARFAYLLTQTPVNGAYNFSATINNPFFCDNEYTPTWDAEANCYKYNDEIENTYATIQEQDYKAALSNNPDWIDFASNVAITQKDVEGQWVINTTTWHGSGFDAITMQHSYTAIGGWTASPTGNAEIMYQTITGLPNGYYSMSGLMCNAGAEVSPLQYVFIEADGVTEKANLTQKGDPWWGGGRDVWRQSVWQKLNTNMVYVSDGKAKIGSSSDAFYATTGFQLYYYGENPDFDLILAPSIAAVKSSIETLLFAGDKAAANAILAQIPETVDSQEAYQKALATIAEASDYVVAANNAVNAFNNNTLDAFSKLAESYEEGTDENAIVVQAYITALGVGENETDTYHTAEAVAADYDAYVLYLAYLGEAKKIDDADVASVIAEQVAYLKDNYADAAQLEQFKILLSAPYNKAVIASIGGAGATENAPADATALIVNPTFNEGTKGWNGELTVDNELKNAERYNTDFDVHQTIYNLPAGAYRITVNAFYRDGDMQSAYNNWIYIAYEDVESWENANVVLYANTSGSETATVIQSIATARYYEPSFTEYISEWRVAEEGDEHGDDVLEPVYTYIDMDNIAFPFDAKVDDLGNVFYFPNSMRGAEAVFSKNDGNYLNTVTVMVAEGESLTFGLKKNTTVGNDWCMFDNFRLEYLGTAVPTSITTKPTDSAVSAVYSVSGVRQNGLQKGVNIVKMSDNTVRKIFVR